MNILEAMLPLILIILIFILVGYVLYKLLETHLSDEKVIERYNQNHKIEIEKSIKKMDANPYKKIYYKKLIAAIPAIPLAALFIFVKPGKLTDIWILFPITWGALLLGLSSTISYYLNHKKTKYIEKAISIGEKIPGTIISICDEKHETNDTTYYEYYLVVSYYDSNTCLQKSFLTPRLNFNPHDVLGSSNCSVYIYKDTPVAYDFISSESTDKAEYVKTDNSY